MPRGYARDLYVLPFDHRGSFETKMFGWEPPLSAAQTAEIAAAWRARKATHEQAVAEIARRYREFVDIFEKAGHSTAAPAPAVPI